MLMCPNLETIVFPEGLESIDVVVVGDCPMLTRVHIPASVTFINDDNFYDRSDKVVIVTPRDSYAWQWARRVGLAVAEPD